jgi:hypothetical protein
MYVHRQPETDRWEAVVNLPPAATSLLQLGKGGRTVSISRRFQNAADAATAADLAQLALLGPWNGMRLNFPLWQYSSEQQTPKAGPELMQYLNWLKAQADSEQPFAAGFDPGQAAAAAAAGGGGRPRKRFGEAALQAMFVKQVYACGMCARCLTKGRCVVAAWQAQRQVRGAAGGWKEGGQCAKGDVPRRGAL